MLLGVPKLNTIFVQDWNECEAGFLTKTRINANFEDFGL